MPIVTLPESCEGCGACCYGLLVEVTQEDFAVHGVPRDKVTVASHPDDGEPTTVMRQVGENKRCIALDADTNRCTIYENRPGVCRGFKRGDDEARPNKLCFDVVNGMRFTQGRMALPPETRFEQALAALNVLDGKDIDGASPAEQLTFLRLVAELQAGMTLTMLADLIASQRRAERDFATLLNASDPEVLERIAKLAGVSKKDTL